MSFKLLYISAHPDTRKGGLYVVEADREFGENTTISEERIIAGPLPYKEARAHLELRLAELLASGEWKITIDGMRDKGGIIPTPRICQ